MKTLSLSGFMLAALLAGSASLQAAPGTPPPFPPMDMPMMQPGMPPPHGPMMPDVRRLEKAGATEEQIQAYSDFWYDQQVQRIGLRAASETADIELDRLMHAKTPADETAIQEAIDAVNEARGALFKLEILSQVTTKQILGDKIMRSLCEQDRPRPDMQGPRACLLKAPPPPQEVDDKEQPLPDTNE